MRKAVRRVPDGFFVANFVIRDGNLVIPLSSFVIRPEYSRE
ncbi:hypothetical protein C772_00896 [Bhargavaea cecembensis DSE10]|uniref:Uncharacterized protein n=1 Tax=Bhargavaea cecembensis DSE10 TaxID=1235279 RepID=M7NJD8_9BACL|nr:hypothetical protein C772_00896 [Bhargavaea cecembensis DSE10]